LAQVDPKRSAMIWRLPEFAKLMKELLPGDTGKATEHGFKVQEKHLVPGRPTGSGQRWRAADSFSGAGRHIGTSKPNPHQRPSLSRAG
jgi:hypothetical protein